MLSCQSQSDAGIKQMVALIAQICMSREFKALQSELEQIYVEAKEDNYELVAFQDALYTILLQTQESSPHLKELLACL